MIENLLHKAFKDKNFSHDHLNNIHTQTINFNNSFRENLTLIDELFTDSLFPPDQISIKPSYHKSKIVYDWRRISTVFPEFYLKRIIKSEQELIDDIVQGDLGDCYFMSALSSFAELGTRVDNLFSEINKSKSGMYKINCFIDGIPLSVLLDDYFPVRNNRLCFSNIEQDSLNIWPLLLEKAYAKVNSNYFNIVEGNVSEALSFLSPAPHEIYRHKQEDLEYSMKVYSMIKYGDKYKAIICGDINSANSKLMNSIGLLENHAYSIISLHEIKNFDGETIKLLKIRNPWGNFEWNGDWSDEDPKWNESLKKELNFSQAKDDGFFFMAFKDYYRLFTNTYIMRHKEDYHYVYKRIDRVIDRNVYYFEMVIKSNVISEKFTNTFSSKEEGKNNEKSDCGYMILNQYSSKIYQNLTNDKNFKNPFVSLTIINENSEIFKSCCSSLDRIHLEADFKPAKYFVIIEFHYSEETLSNDFSKIREKFTVGLYSSFSDVEFEISHCQ
jgi:hypothetical protein